MGACNTTKLKLVCFIAFLCLLSTQAQNMLATDIQEWVSGTSGRTNSFSLSGGANQRISIPGPYNNGENIVAWSAQSTATAVEQSLSGGWIHKGVLLNTSNTYRITFWMKSTGTSNCNNNGAFYLRSEGVSSNIKALRVETGLSEVNWPSLINKQLTDDKWYLVVGYIYGSGTTVYDLPSGVYDPATFDVNNPTVLPTPVTSAYSFKFPNTYAELNTRLRNDLYACPQGDTQLSYAPRLEQVNSQMKPLVDILNPNQSQNTTNDDNMGTNNTTSVWSEAASQAVFYNGGNVGIGTNNTDAYKLAVNGKIHSKEVRVDLQDWPDFVFDKDYHLLDINRLENFIINNGHLPNIPSAKNVQANGVELGKMKKLLLEKIEQLTLYIIEQEERITRLEKLNKKSK